MEAALTPDFGEKFDILYNPWTRNGTDERLRFRVGHELGHAVFFNWNEVLPE